MRALVGCVLIGGMASVSWGHDHRPAWADVTPGIFVQISGAAAVRGDASPWIVVKVLNTTSDDATLVRVELLEDGVVVASEVSSTLLHGVGDAVVTWQRAERKLATLHEQRSAMSKLMVQQATAMQTIGAGLRSCRLDPLTESCSDYVVRVTTEQQGTLHHEDMSVQLTCSPALPRGIAPAQRFARVSDGSWQLITDEQIGSDEVWLAGDQHLHTTWSLDAHVLDGTEEGPAGYADAARAVGLDWIMITDHSNIHAWWGGDWFFTPEQHEAARQEAASYRASELWPVLYSQEMGLGRTGFWEVASHMLVYPLDTFDAPYLENPSDGLVFGHAECEDEQVVIDRINSNGCYGFIAHAFDEGTLSFAKWNWNNGATGWAGLEIWCDAESTFKEEDLQALNKWHDLLRDIAPPSGGVLADRPGFPTRFPVGIGNSDAHQTGHIGQVFTYAPLESVSPTTLREVFLSGRCVASDGPLVTLSCNTSSIGDVAILPDGKARTVVRLETTSEFGTVDQYTLVLEKDGEALLTLPTGDASGYAVEYVIDSPTMFADGTHLTAWAQRNDLERLAMTNPVWLQPAMPGDVDGSGSVTIDDMLAMLGAWGPCAGCPADANRDGVVDVNDVLLLLAAWSI